MWCLLDVPQLDGSHPTLPWSASTVLASSLGRRFLVCVPVPLFVVGAMYFATSVQDVYDDD